MRTTDIILVIEKNQDMEMNSILTLQDFKKYAGVEDNAEKPETAGFMLELGRSLGEPDAWIVGVNGSSFPFSARFCTDANQLGSFLQGRMNAAVNWKFMPESSSPECMDKMKKIGMTDKGWIDDYELHYEKLDQTFKRGQRFHNFNGSDYMVLEKLSDTNLLVVDIRKGNLVVALGVNEYARYPSGQEPTEDNTVYGVSWENGVYLGNKLSSINFRALKKTYGTPDPVEDVYDYRANVKQKFYAMHDLLNDDLVTEEVKKAALGSLYTEFGTSVEETFIDNFYDGKYDSGFRDVPSVSEEKVR